MKANTNFREKHELDMPLLSDPEKTVHEKYGVMVEKNMVGKTVTGADRSTFLIDPSGTIRRIWRKVKVAGHVDEVLEALKEAQAG